MSDPKIDKLTIALRMINRRCRMVACSVDGGRQSSAEPLHADCDVFAIGTDHRQIEDSDLHALRVAVQSRAVPVQDVDLGSQHRLVRRQVAAIGLLGDDAQRTALARAADNDRHVADRPWIAGGFRQVHVAAVVGLGAGSPKRPERLDADLKSIKSLTVVGKVQAVRLMLPQPPAGTEAAEGAAIAEHIKGRDGLGDDARFAKGDGGDQSAQPKVGVQTRQACRG